MPFLPLEMMECEADALVDTQEIETSLEIFDVPKTKRGRKVYGSVEDGNKNDGVVISCSLTNEAAKPKESLWQDLEDNDRSKSIHSDISDVESTQEPTDTVHDSDDTTELSMTVVTTPGHSKKIKASSLERIHFGSDEDAEKEDSDEASYAECDNSDAEQGSNKDQEEDMANKPDAGRRKKVAAKFGDAASSDNRPAHETLTPVNKSDPLAMESTIEEHSNNPDPKFDSPISELPNFSTQLTQTQVMTQTTDTQPDLDTLETSIDVLFELADKNTVTVRDIVSSLEAEYDVKFTKATKNMVRDRLKALIDGAVDEKVDEDEEVSEQGDDESEAEISSDEESFKQNRRPTSKKAKPSRATRPVRNASTTKKPSAQRIHADMLRQRRMEELRVRNEEMQAAENKEDQERAQDIAKIFDTNTDELRLKRLEDRLDLLAKLDQKRFQVIVKEEDQGEDDEEDDEVVSSAVENETEKAPEAVSTGESDSDSDDELEILVAPHTFAATSKVLISPTSKASALLTMPLSKALPQKKGVAWSSTTSPGKSRAALRTMLQKKQRHIGNLWLARELGYKSEQEHLDDCRKAEARKRSMVIALEEERQKNNERKILRERMLMQDAHSEQMEEQELEDGDEEYQPEEGEDDEEVALAIEIAKEEAGNRENSSNPGVTHSSHNLEIMEKTFSEDDADVPVRTAPAGEDDATIPSTIPGIDDASTVVSGQVDDDVSTVVFDQDDDDTMVAFEREQGRENESDENSLQIKTPPQLSEKEKESTEAEPRGSTAPEPKSQQMVSHSNSEVGPIDVEEATDEAVPTSSGNAESETSDEDAHAAFKPSGKEGKKKDRNAAWKAMLQLEAQRAKKLKNRKGSGLVEAEADEEEEEEIAGLEDFGFSLNKKKKDNDDDEEQDADELDEEDLKHVVDDISDDEGDEDAGEEARLAMQQLEEKEQHKEMLRRMRDGYDGRRGGIAGGGVGARGMHRFDQLVAADNREDAKRLGLLNDDELDSDAEGGGDDAKDNGEIEDENALLDKMLKDRFLHRSSAEGDEEQFSDDEEDNEEESTSSQPKNEEDQEEAQQELLAKRFAKRARMQRLLESHGDDEEFSQMRLIDEDVTMKLELKSMKDAFSRRRQTSTASRVSNSNSENSQLAGNSQRAESQSSANGSLFSQHSSLSLALQASRKKQKTSFLGGSNAAGKDKSSAMQRSVAFNHVVFLTESSQLSKMNMNNNSQAKKTMPVCKRKRSAETSSSLWSKVSADSFKRRR